MKRLAQYQIIYLINFLRDLNLITATLAPLMLAGNLPLHTFFLTLAIFRISFSLFSIPCGMLADKIGPKKSLIYSGVLALCSALSLAVLGKTLPGFLVMNFFNCLSACLLIAASSNALMEVVGSQEEYLEKYPQKLSLRKFSAFLSGLLSAGAILLFGINSIVWLQVVFYGLFLIVTLNFKPKNEIHTNSASWADYLIAFKTIPYFEMFKVIIVALPFFVCMDLFLQPMLTKANFPAWLVTTSVSLSNLLIFWSMKNSLKWGAALKRFDGVSVLVSLSPVFLYALTGSAILGLIGVVLTIISRSSSVLQMGIFTKDIPSKSRGTYEAVLNTINSSLIGGLSFGFSFLDKAYGMRTASYSLIGILLLALLAFKLWSRTRKT